jgi:hypothetical protein
MASRATDYISGVLVDIVHERPIAERPRASLVLQHATRVSATPEPDDPTITPTEVDPALVPAASARIAEGAAATVSHPHISEATTLEDATTLSTGDAPSPSTTANVHVDIDLGLGVAG